MSEKENKAEKNEREKRSRFKPNGRFQNWNQISLKLCCQFSRFLWDVWRLLFTGQMFKKECVRWSKVSRKHLLQYTRLCLWNTHPSFCNTWSNFWKTRPNFWKFERKLKAWSRVWKALTRVCVITRPTLSQSATVVGPSYLQGCLCEI